MAKIPEKVKEKSREMKARNPVLGHCRIRKSFEAPQKGLIIIGNRMPVLCLKRLDEQQKINAFLEYAKHKNVIRSLRCDGVEIKPISQDLAEAESEITPSTSPQVFDAAPFQISPSPSSSIPSKKIVDLPHPVVAEDTKIKDMGPVLRTGLEYISPLNALPKLHSDTPQYLEDQLDQQIGPCAPSALIANVEDVMVLAGPVDLPVPGAAKSNQREDIYEVEYPVSQTKLEDSFPNSPKFYSGTPDQSDQMTNSISGQMLPDQSNRGVSYGVDVEFIDISDDDDGPASQTGYEDWQPSYSGAPPKYHHQGQQHQEMPNQQYQQQYHQAYSPINPLNNPQDKPGLFKDSPPNRDTQFYLNNMDKISLEHNNDKTIWTIPVTLVLKRSIKVVSKKSEELTQAEILTSLHEHLSYLQDNQGKRDYAIHVRREKSTFQSPESASPNPAEGDFNGQLNKIVRN